MYKHKKVFITFTSSNMFDHYGCFKQEGFIDWWISPQPNPGDIFYIFSDAYDCIIAKTVVERTQLKKASAKMKNYYDLSKLEEYEHPTGYNPLKCMRIIPVSLTDLDYNRKVSWNELKKFGLDYPTKNNKTREITSNKKIRNYLEDIFG